MSTARDHIGFFGKMNAGKSTVMNLLTQQITSIVDATPGTTADTRTTLLEFHGLGPVKLYDTAGIDELSDLGVKKRSKVMADLKECDLILLIINPESQDFSPERELIDVAREHDKQLLIAYNTFSPQGADAIPAVEQAIPLSRFYRKISLEAIDPSTRPRLQDFIRANFESKRISIPLLPFAQSGKFYPLIIIADAETPPERLLRPQTMAIAELTRKGGWPVCYQLNLPRARAGDADEKERFERFLSQFGPDLATVISDSQAMDIMSRWVAPDIGLTTFSIMMINFTSQGRLANFAEGATVLDTLREGDRILIAEACNHARMTEDIGTVQIPGIINKRWPGVIVEHNFGREFQDNQELRRYRLVVHCGGCMISTQKLQARIRDLDNIGVPYTNYGIFLSYAQGAEALGRVLKPWG